MIAKPLVLIQHHPCDEYWKTRLKTQLAAHVQEGVFDIWDASCVQGGDVVALAQAQAREKAAIVVLLLSANYLAEPDAGDEIKIADQIRQWKRQGTKVYALHATSCDWENADWLGDSLIWPRRKQAIALGAEALQEDDLAELAREIRGHIRQNPTSRFQVHESEYRRCVENKFRWLSIHMRSADPIRLPIEEVFVDLKYVPDIPPAADAFPVEERRLMAEMSSANEARNEELRFNLERLRADRHRALRRADPNHWDAQSALARMEDANRGPLVLLGDPGTGKTTLLYLAAYLAASRGFLVQGSPLRAQNTREANLLPIFIPLSAYDDHIERHKLVSQDALIDYLSIYWKEREGQPDLSEVFLDALESGRALVLLDGLDEVLTRDRRHFVKQQVEAFTRYWKTKGNRIVITSRSIGYHEAPIADTLCDHGTILHFNQSDIQAFLGRWCEAIQIWSARENTEAVRADAKKLAKTIDEELQANSSAYELATTPLMLSMLTVLRCQEGVFPKRPIEVYKRFLDLLLEQQPVKRSSGVRDRAVDYFDIADKRSHLKRLALWLMEHRPSGTASKDDIVRELSQQFLSDDADRPESPSERERKEADRKGKAMLDELRLLSGIVLERGRDAYGFAHLTFQEFFAAEALAKQPQEERWALISAHLHEPRWRKTIALCAGWLGVVLGQSKDVDDLLRRIVGARSKHEGFLYRDLFLAMEVVAQDVRVSRRVWGELFPRLQELVGHRIELVGRLALRRLADLARLGYEPAIEYFVTLVQKGELFSPSRKWHAYFALQGILDEPHCEPIRGALLACFERRLETLSDTGDPSRDEHTFDWLRENNLFLSRLTEKSLWQREDCRRMLIRAIHKPYLRLDESIFQGMGFWEEDHELVHLLMEALEGDKKIFALNVLGPLAAKDKRIEAIFEQHKEHKNVEIQRAVVGAARYLARSKPIWLGYLIEYLKHEDWLVRRIAFDSIATLAIEDPALRRHVLECLAEPRRLFSLGSMKSIQPLARVDEHIRSSLLGLLSHPSDSVRKGVLESLGPLVGSHPLVCDAIQQKLEDKDQAVRLRALRILAPVSLAQPALKRHFKGRMKYMKGCTLQARMVTMAPRYEADPAIKRWLGAFPKDQDPALRKAAIRSIAEHARNESSWLNELIQMLQKDSSEDVREIAVRELERWVSSDAQVLEALIAMVGDQNWTIAQIGARALRDWVAHPPVRNALIARWKQDEDKPFALDTGILASLIPSDTEVRELFVQLSARLTEMSVHAYRYSDSQWYEAFHRIGPAIGHDESIRNTLISLMHLPRIGAMAYSILLKYSADPVIHQDIERDLESADLGLRSKAMLALAKLPDAQLESRPSFWDCLDWTFVNDRSGDLLEYALSKPILHPRLWAWIISVLDSIPASWRVEWPSPVQKLLKHLGPHLANHPDLVAALRSLLDRLNQCLELNHGGWSRLRMALVQILAPFMAEDKELRATLLPWLGVRTPEDNQDGMSTRRVLAQAYAPLLCSDPELHQKIKSMLDSPAWQERQGAAWTLWASPIEKSPEDLQKLSRLLDDERCEESWLERLEAAAAFVNHPDSELSAEALRLAWQALHLPRDPWCMPLNHDIRQSAVRVLSALEPLFYDAALMDQVQVLLNEECNAELRDSLFHVALRLAAAPEKTLYPS